ncbi:MAG: hypothetical protein LBM95_06490 [Lactobacillales bacterium]|jgi:hypothetical protein|nr:hypothetical protein [Lactobacillales bacterium]
MSVLKFAEWNEAKMSKKSKRKNKKNKTNKTNSPKKATLHLDEVKDLTVGTVQELAGVSAAKEEEKAPEKTVEEKPKEEAKDEPESKGLAERLQEKVDAQTEKTDANKANILEQYIQAHKPTYTGPTWEEGAGKAIVKGEVTSLEEVQTEGALDTEPKKAEKEEAVETVVETKEVEAAPNEVQVEEDNEIKEEAKEVPEKSSSPILDEAIPAPIPDEEPKVAEPTEEQETTTLTAKWKKGALIVAGVVILGGAGYAGYSTYNDNVEKAKSVQLAKEKAKVADVKSEISKFYLNDKKEFIKTSKLADFPALEKQYKKLKGSAEFETLTPVFEKLEQKVTLTNQVNALFVKPAIVDDKLGKNPQLAKLATVTLEITKDNTPLSKLAQQAVDEAKAQYQQAKQVQDKIVELNKEIGDPTNEKLKQANDLIAKVKSEPIKKELTSELAPYIKKLNELNAKQSENEMKQAEVAVQQPAPAPQETAQAPATPSQTQGQPAPATTGGETSFGVANAAPGARELSVVPYNQAAINNTASSAWVWAPGIKERVLATCIARGYITATNYTIEPVNIINGNGYYNLFGPNGNYLVSINCKTGWFMGNAKGHTDTLDFDPSTAVYG